MREEWPGDDDLLLLVRESHEYERVWRLVRGLAKKLYAERQNKAPRLPSQLYSKPTGPKPSGWDDKLKELEHKVIAQKEQLKKLEECRVFEAETERLLVATLIDISGATPENPAMWCTAWAQHALEIYAQRRGPREG